MDLILPLHFSVQTFVATITIHTEVNSVSVEFMSIYACLIFEVDHLTVRTKDKGLYVEICLKICMEKVVCGVGTQSCLSIHCITGEDG